MGGEQLKRTPLYDSHVKLGGKIVPFAGWELPVQYAGVIAEHRAVRTGAGLFDVSHMGEVFCEGPEAEAALDYLTCNDVKGLYDGRAQYSAICNEQGGVVDDIIIYRYSPTRYLICVNASNADKDFAWFQKHNKHKATFTNKSSEYGQIALQGPKAVAIMRAFESLAPCTELRYYHFQDAKVLGIPVIVARTGYTGEDGFELFVPVKSTRDVWEAFIEIGARFGLVPCGLGARDSLRLEASYPLHGHELGDDITAIESKLGWIVRPEKKGDFIGRAMLEKQKKEGAPRSVVGFFVDDPGIARQGDKVFSGSGVEVGAVTSGTKTPTLDRALGLALVKSDQAKVGTEIFFEVRGKKLKGHVVATPLYKRA